MRTLVWLLLLSCCFYQPSCLLAEELPPAAKQELSKLQGKWIIVSSERDGKRESQPAEPSVIVIQEDKILLGDRDVQLRITLLGTESQPKLIDITQIETKQRIEGVYELHENEWKVCLNTDVEGAAERPSELKSEGKAKFVLVILKRDQP
jgi:uncharacterized protein (TIGR03067 family)